MQDRYILITGLVEKLLLSHEIETSIGEHHVRGMPCGRRMASSLKSPHSTPIHMPGSHSLMGGQRQGLAKSALLKALLESREHANQTNKF